MYHDTSPNTLRVQWPLRSWLVIASALMLFASFCAVPVAPAMAQDGIVTPTPRAAVATTPDRCEPNDSLVAPCALQTEVDQTELNFVDGSVDVYSFLFKAGRVYVVSASSADGIDPAIRVFLAGGAETPVAENDDVAAGSTTATVQVAVPADGWYIVEVVNRAPGPMQGKTYRVSARSSTATAAPTTTTQAGAVAVADILENNYDVAHAARIAWGVPYDLTLECPDPRPDACFAGDHDFLLVPVKKGVPFIALTYDLGAGSDTTVTLYAPDTAPSASENLIPGWRAVVGNDDTDPGRTLRSQVLYTPMWDGDALLIIAESQRRNPPIVPSALGPAGRYRLIAGSPNMEALQAVLGTQSDTPLAQPTSTGSRTAVPASAQPTSTGSRVVATPVAVATNAPGSASTASNASTPPLTATPTAAGASVDAPAPAVSDDEEEIIREDCTTGLAVVARTDAPFYSAGNPTSERRLLTTYPKGTEITLLGSCYIGWVKAQPDGSVTPGWMFAPDLTLVEGLTPVQGTESLPSTANQSVSSTPRPARSGTPVPAVSASTTTKVQVVRAPSPVLAPAPTAEPPQAATMTVRVVRASAESVAGVAVQLVDVYGTVVSDAVTGVDGQVVFTFPVRPNVALRVQLPALSVSAPVDLANPLVTVTLPGRAS